MGTHFYEKDGKKYPSVTTIIGDCTDKSQALTQWAANQVVEWIKQNCSSQGVPWMGKIIPMFYAVFEEEFELARKNFREVSKEALDTGSEVHAAIEHYFKTSEEPQDPKPEVLSAFLAFLEWKDKHNVEPIFTEHLVYGDNYAGTTDLICRMAGNKYLVDFKTSKALYGRDSFYQVAAYRAASDPDIEGCGVLRIDKITGYPEWKDSSKKYEDDLNVFMKMVELYYAKHPRIRGAFYGRSNSSL